MEEGMDCWSVNGCNADGRRLYSDGLQTTHVQFVDKIPMMQTRKI